VTTNYAVTNPAVIAAIRERMAYARQPLLHRVFHRPPAGWSSWRKPAEPRAVDDSEYQAVLDRVLAPRPPASSTCTTCGFQREEHRSGHCPDGGPGNTFATQTDRIVEGN